MLCKKNIYHHHHHQPTNVLTAGAQTFLVDNTWGNLYRFVIKLTMLCSKICSEWIANPIDVMKFKKSFYAFKSF
jgi:hypothetical protein